MTSIPRNPLRRLLTVLLLAAAVPGLHAQTYPTKPIRVIVPFPAGGNADVVVRLVTAQMSQKLGQTVVVDFKGMRTEAYKLKAKLFRQRYPDLVFEEWDVSILKQNGV